MVRLTVVSHRLTLASIRGIVGLPERTVALVARIVGAEAKSVALGHELIAAGQCEAEAAPIRVGAPIRPVCPGTIVIAIGAAGHCHECVHRCTGRQSSCPRSLGSRSQRVMGWSSQPGVWIGTDAGCTRAANDWFDRHLKCISQPRSSSLRQHDNGGPARSWFSPWRSWFSPWRSSSMLSGALLVSCRRVV